MTQKFNNAKIYKITNDYNDDVYIGSTCDTLTKRFSVHKNFSVSKKHRPLYVLMKDIGIERFRIDLIEEYPCKDKMELNMREGYYIRDMGTLNIQIAGRTKAEYQKTPKVKEYQKLYNQINKDELNKKAKEYRDTNKDEKKKRDKEYYLKNREKILLKTSEYRKKAKEHRDINKKEKLLL